VASSSSSAHTQPIARPTSTKITTSTTGSAMNKRMNILLPA
jgi:hypothetical protein